MPKTPQRRRSDWFVLHILFCVLFLVVTGTCYAYVPTAEQECQFRNSAICELNGNQYHSDSDCRPEARVIKPLGHERCDQPAQTNNMIVPVNPSKVAPEITPPDHLDLADIGNIERWLLPTLVIAGALIAFGMVVWAIRWSWLHRFAGNIVLIRSAAVSRFVLSVMCSVYAAYYTFGMVYMRIFSSYSNHESAGPALIAAPPAFIAASLVAITSFPLTNWVLKTILAKYVIPSGDKEP